ncbi:hypothetical protein [Cryptosporangium sp. NPDC048952]|uniref:hypothetical protein n=1 Tax=Cryptosporangium sp. NPDC048952 TaxID=3363961 RepID=UPI003723DFDF
MILKAHHRGSTEERLMTDRRDATILLVHRGRPIPLGCVKVMLGVLLFAAAIAGVFFIRASGGGVLFYLLWVLPGVFLVDWGSPMLADGVTDLVTRRSWRTIESGRALEIGPDGVRYFGAFPLRLGAAVGRPDVVAGWAEVSAAGFRPGEAESWWWCLDLAPEAWPTEQRAEHLTVRDRLIAGSAPDESTARRRITENVLRVGTPIAVNPLICPGVSVRRIDRTIRACSGGRLRCRPVERPWWWPPRLPWRATAG